MSFDQRDTIGFQAAQISRLISNRVREALAPLGLLPAQVAALVEIGADEGLSQKSLVVRLDVEQPGVARTLATLETEGWIARRSGGGRTQGLHLTDKARSVVPEAARRVAEVNGAALGELSRTERAHLLDRLSELVAELKAG
jgi:DNA-binding MarR family transcriptional regulator